jgi:DNA-binding NarL/FixJ family response regulator
MYLQIRATTIQRVKLVLDLKPDILLVDLNGLQPHSGGSRMQVLCELASKARNLRTILLLTAAIDKKQVVEALKLGARGVVRKEASTALLLKCISAVMVGGYWISRDAIAELVINLEFRNTLLEHRSKVLDCRLSRRELQAVRAIASGGSNKDIAQELIISEQAVEIPPHEHFPQNQRVQPNGTGLLC